LNSSSVLAVYAKMDTITPTADTTSKFVDTLRRLAERRPTSGDACCEGISCSAGPLEVPSTPRFLFRRTFTGIAPVDVASATAYRRSLGWGRNFFFNLRPHSRPWRPIPPPYATPPRRERSRTACRDLRAAMRPPGPQVGKWVAASPAPQVSHGLARIFPKGPPKVHVGSD
jgi:hypothetical protein